MAKLILLQHTEHKVGFFREKNKRILSNKSALGKIFLERWNGLQSYWEVLIFWLNLFLDSTGKFSSTSSRGQTFKKHYLARKSSYWCCYTFTADNQRSFGAFLSSTLRYTIMDFTLKVAVFKKYLNLSILDIVNVICEPFISSY